VPSNHESQLWIWGTEEGQFYFDNYETVRVKILTEEWTDQGSRAVAQNPEEQPASPYKLVGSMADEGLGPCIWWEE
jgi:DNA-directed RNA polymerase III subunit RPC8